ncbi:hypothetical protein B0H10DRAFT_2236002 [Mycena sp. CBHHK59/15]|nr:hypothetical protein B0H10DRAFT_2236002 [Mycena sp. CBHHK59/15]
MLQELWMLRDPLATVDPESDNSSELFIGLLTLGSQESEDILCPLLRGLHIGFSDVSDNALLEFIQSRTDLNLDTIYLSDIYVNFRRHLEINIILPLQARISNGLKVSLSYTSARLAEYSPSEANQMLDMDWELVSTTWSTYTW